MYYMAEDTTIMKSTDRLLFESIRIDPLYIYVLEAKIKRNKIGLYNQIAHYINTKHKGKIELFNDWIKHNYVTIEKWEKSVTDQEKPNIVAAIFKMRRRTSSCIEFYIKNNGIYEYIASTLDRDFYKVMSNYLLYNRNVTAIVDDYELVHPLEKKLPQVIKDIQEAIRYGLIPELNSTDNVFKADPIVDIRDELSHKYYNYNNSL